MSFLLGALGLALSTGIWLHFILKKDRIEREPLRTFILVGFAGGVISIVLAMVLNAVFSSATGIHFLSRPLPLPDAAALSLFVGVSEEFLKCGAAILLIGRLKEFDEPADGVIYAMAVSLGFAAIENILYMVQNGPGVIVARSCLSVPGHLGFGAVWGTGLAAAKFRLPKGRALPVVMPYFIAAALFHALYDFWLFAFLPLRPVVAAAIVLSLWVYASRETKFLVAHSPFLPMGQCPECGTRNRTRAEVCAKCGATMYPDRSL